MMFDRKSADEKLMEREELGQLEAVIERGQQTFVEVSQALAAIGTRAVVARDPAVPAPTLNALDSDDRIEQGLAEHLPWADGEIDLGITSLPYCLGEKIQYAGGQDYDNYDAYRDELHCRRGVVSFTG